MLVLHLKFSGYRETLPITLKVGKPVYTFLLRRYVSPCCEEDMAALLLVLSSRYYYSKVGLAHYVY